MELLAIIGTIALFFVALVVLDKIGDKLDSWRANKDRKRFVKDSSQIDAELQAIVSDSGEVEQAASQ